MNIDKETISMLLTKHIVGTITPEEQKQLDAWRAESELRENAYQRLLNDDWLTRELNRIRQFASEAPLVDMKQRLGIRQDSSRSHRYLAAAAVALLLVAGAATLWYRDYTRVTPPELTAEVRQAMERCEANGIQEADVAIQSIEPTRGPQTSRTKQNGKTEVGGETETPTQDDAVKKLLTARRVTTRQDKEYWLTLPDGSILHLNNSSRVIYPEQFIGDTRDIYIDGKVYLMIAKDKRHPFIVHTPQGDIKVLGTEFAVNTCIEGNACTMVVLVNGHISVTMPDGEPHDLYPGDKALLYNDRKDPIVSQVDPEPYVAWNTGKYLFEDCPLDKLMDVLGRWYGYTVEFDSEQTRQLLFTGELDRYDSVEPTLSAISEVKRLNIQIYDGKIHISQNK